MARQSLPPLDDKELIHLAYEASRAQRHGDAIAYLKQAVAQSSTNFMAIYLLAAQHAQIGLTERAIEEFRQALAIEPRLTPARFQLGLLLVCNARVEEALAAWAPLDELPDSDPFLHFKRGMERLTRDEFAAAEESLKRGLELNRVNPSLNRDMRGVLEQIAAQRVSAQPAAPDQQPGRGPLSAYTRTKTLN
jgi:tetratricopeptide (TPR) repeat protein